MRTMKDRLPIRIAVVGIACCSLSLTGCVYGPCGPVYIWQMFGSQTGNPSKPGQTNETASIFRSDIGGTHFDQDD
jgi:hypothetical protein